MFLRPVLSLAAGLMLASPLWAAPATPEGAAHLQAVFQRYLGATPGVVTAAPEGEAYRVTLDAAPLLAGLPGNDVRASVSPLVLMLADQGGGSWQVSADQAFAAGFAMPGQKQSFDLAVDRVAMTGTFDESLMAFVRAEATLTGYRAEQVQDDGTGPVHSVTEVAETRYVSTSEKSASGPGVDQTVEGATTGYVVRMDMPLPEAAPLVIEARAARLATEASAEGVRPDAIYGLIGWFVAHPSADLIVAGQEDLKARIASGMPYWKAVTARSSAEEIAVTTPVGVVGADSLGLVVDMTGVVTAGRLREAVTLDGLRLPEGLVPGWASGLVPTRLSLDVAVGGFDLASPLRLVLDRLDLTRPEAMNEAFGMELLAALLPHGTVAVTLAPGMVEAPLYQLGYEGRLSAGPEAMPVGSARVTAKGLDAAIEALNGAPDDVRQMGMGLAMVRGMARVEADGMLVWDIDATTPGSVLINGTDLGPLLQQ